MRSISDGITGQKGDVNLNIGKAIKFDSDSYEDCSEKITKNIKNLYYLHPTNYAAAIIQGKENIEYPYELKEIEKSIDFLEKRINLIPDEMQSYLLNQYSKPLET